MLCCADPLQSAVIRMGIGRAVRGSHGFRLPHKEPHMSERTVGPAEIAGVFLKIGAMSYGGPAIMGIMQTEAQEKRGWISKQEFVEGLALVNMLPGPGATQLGIFIG